MYYAPTVVNKFYLLWQTIGKVANAKEHLKLLKRCHRLQHRIEHIITWKCLNENSKSFKFPSLTKESLIDILQKLK